MSQVAPAHTAWRKSRNGVTVNHEKRLDTYSGETLRNGEHHANLELFLFLFLKILQKSDKPSGVGEMPSTLRGGNRETLHLMKNQRNNLDMTVASVH